MLHCGYCGAMMNDVVDRVLETYELMGGLDAARLGDFRQKITNYIETLSSAGLRDAQKLVMYGLAYLKELHEGPDRRFTGC